MRTRASLAIVLALAVTGCTTSHRAANSSDAELSPLGSCETRVISLPGTQLVVNANADASLGSVRVVHAAGDAERDRALATVNRAFGRAHPDTSVVARQSKWGLTTFTDPCGRPVTP
ncbi:MAG: hypothetical protein JOZ01_09620 [Candidatus Eremiobacteraeota bacterium]|nr:hypothetical protein [Candidatus Eremiobacteraeota bacterium]